MLGHHWTHFVEATGCKTYNNEKVVDWEFRLNVTFVEDLK